MAPPLSIPDSTIRRFIYLVGVGLNQKKALKVVGASRGAVHKRIHDDDVLMNLFSAAKRRNNRRDYTCTHYDECLDVHAKENLKFRCDGCYWKCHTGKVELDDMTLDGCYRLLRELWPKK